ncbi:MAG: ribosomal protein L13e [Candidatus Bathyarchaeota archaeon]|nr:ribosomal protein L13e [Candidatus Bathyarchaeota archaeon]
MTNTVSIVKQRGAHMGATRKGRGFSKSELYEAGLSIHAAIRLGIRSDPLRRTKHQKNIDELRLLVDSMDKDALKIRQHSITRCRQSSKPHRGRTHRGLTSSGKRTRGLLRTRGLKSTRNYKFKK